MPYLLLAFSAVAIAAFASPKYLLSLLVCIGVLTSAVRVAATTIIGPVSYGAAARAVVWASLMPALIVLALLLASDGKLHVDGYPAVALLLSLFVSFVLGFKFSLGATFAASTGIALASTVISVALLIMLKPLLF
jgi:hypothetical protein